MFFVGHHALWWVIFYSMLFWCVELFKMIRLLVLFVTFIFLPIWISQVCHHALWWVTFVAMPFGLHFSTMPFGLTLSPCPSGHLFHRALWRITLVTVLFDGLRLSPCSLVGHVCHYALWWVRFVRPVWICQRVTFVTMPFWIVEVYFYYFY